MPVSASTVLWRARLLARRAGIRKMPECASKVRWRARLPARRAGIANAHEEGHHAAPGIAPSICRV